MKPLQDRRHTVGITQISFAHPFARLQRPSTKPAHILQLDLIKGKSWFFISFIQLFLLLSQLAAEANFKFLTFLSTVALLQVDELTFKSQLTQALTDMFVMLEFQARLLVLRRYLFARYEYCSYLS